MSGHSGLIPGSPTLPLMGGAGSNSGSFDGNSLLGRSLPNAPQGSSASMPLDPSQRMATQNLPPAPVSPRSRSLKKPKRTSNVFMIALAVLFLAGFLAAVGWLFREPVMQLVERYLPAKVELVAEVSESPMAESQKELQVASRPVAPEKPAPQPPVEATAKTAESSTPKTASSFDPMESAPTPPKAQAASSEEILAATSAMKPTQEPKLPTATVTEPTQGTALVEVAPKAVPAGTQEATSKENTLDMQERKEVRLEVPEEAKPAAVALQKFFDAANMEERLALTLAPDAMKPIMERYYSVNKDGPIRVDAIGLVRYDPKPQLGGGAHAVFGVESKTWEFPVPVMLEQSGGKFKVDWLSFIEFKDRLLEKYLHTYQEGPARFHVGITRTHYFEDKVPNASSRWAFRISPAPPNPFLATIFVDKESVLGRELQTSIPWGAQVWAIFELEWRKLGTQAWVELSAVPQLNWYSVPSAPKAVRSIPSSSVEMPTETQKAVPVGR